MGTILVTIICINNNYSKINYVNRYKDIYVTVRLPARPMEITKNLIFNVYQ